MLSKCAMHLVVGYSNAVSDCFMQVMVIKRKQKRTEREQIINKLHNLIFIKHANYPLKCQPVIFASLLCCH